jgi:ATP-dependent exoDNAse (exonuclease V) beta subunit
MNDMPNETKKNLTRGGLPVTSQQVEIVDHVVNNRVTVVSAGAGSGKTYTTIATILHILEQGLGSIDQFVIITFTNKAADQLKARLVQGIKERYESAKTPQERELWRSQQERLSGALVGTIHRFCSQILRLFGYEEEIARELSITFAKRLKVEAFTQALEERVGRTPSTEMYSGQSSMRSYEFTKLIHRVYDDMRNRGLTPGQVFDWTKKQNEDSGRKYRVAISDLVKDAHEKYASLKQERQVLDSNDLLFRTAQLLARTTTGKKVAKKLSTKYKYILVDEFQDTDYTQKQIVESLEPHVDSVLVVGDKKQSIYRFRGAESSLLDQIAAKYKTDILPLNLSGRPIESLLNVQNTLFESMKHNFDELGERLERRLGTLNPSVYPVPFTYVNACEENDIDARIETTGDAIKDVLGTPIELKGKRTDVSNGHIVVLVRTNRQLMQYRDGLREHGLDVRSDGGSFYQQPEIVATYRLLHQLLHYPDDTSLSLAFQTPYLHEVDAVMEERKILQAQAGVETPLTDWFEDEYPELAEKLWGLRQKVRKETVTQLLADLYQEFDIRNYYDSQNEDAVLNLERLREIARNMFGEDQALTLRQFVDRLQQAIVTDEKEEEITDAIEEEDMYPSYIRILTIHRAKGLEFPVVVIPEVQEDLKKVYLDPDFLIWEGWGLEVDLKRQDVDTKSGNFPKYVDASRQNQLEEEMRVFYVAVTRAQQAVIAVGSGRARANGIKSRAYAWRDEILKARQVLEVEGAKFEGI